MKHIKQFENFFGTDDIDILPPIDVDDKTGGDGDDDMFNYNYKLTGLKYTIQGDDSIKNEISKLNYDIYKENERFNKYMTEYGYVCIRVNNFYEDWFSLDIYLAPKLPRNKMKVPVKDLINEISRILYENVDTTFKYVNYLDYAYWEGGFIML